MRTGTGLLLALAFLAIPTPARAQTGVPGITVEQSHQQLGPFEITGGTVRVDLRMERLRPDSGSLELDETTLVVGFMDEDGEWLFRRPLPNRITPEGYDHCFHVSVDPVELAERRVLRVIYILAPSAPMTGRAVRLFGWRDGAFGPLGPGITGYGRFVGLPRGDDGALRLLDGTVPFDAWTGHFTVRVPLRVDLGRIGLDRAERTRAEPWGLGSDFGDEYVGELGVPEEGPRLLGEAGELTLYDWPEGGTPRTLAVAPGTAVELGPAYGQVRLVTDRRGELVSITVDAYRVRVAVEGDEGWTPDFAALGLPAAEGRGEVISREGAL